MEYDAAAINLLHGDHERPMIWSDDLRVVEMAGSHNIGTPCTTLMRGRASGSYNLRTTDIWGDRGRAE